MPAIDPGETYELIPAHDLLADPSRQRVFIFRHLTCRDWKRAVAALEALDNASTAAHGLDSVLDGLRLGLIGWRNLPEHNGYDAAFLEDVLTNQDAIDLHVKMLAANGLTPDQLKNCVARWVLAAGSSAPIALDQSSAGTSPVQTSPSNLSAQPAPDAAVNAPGSATVESPG